MEIEHGSGLGFKRPDYCPLVYYESGIAEVLAQFQQETCKKARGQEWVRDSIFGNRGTGDVLPHKVVPQGAVIFQGIAPGVQKDALQ
jgi:hypothetical protein